jgi:DNA sulfur modification protein DndD
MERAAAEMGQDLRQKGEIPTPLKRQFVEDLLETGVCICGTELVPGGAPFTAVEDWRTRAGLEEIDEAWTRLIAQIESFRADRAELRVTLRAQQALIAEELASRLRVEEELSDVSSKLSSHEQEDIPILEARRTALVAQFGELRQNEGKYASEAEAAELAQQRIETELSRAQLKNAQAEIAQRRLTALQEVQSILGRVLMIRTQSVRRQLDQRIKDTYRAITFKDYEPELNEKFELGLWQQVAGQRLPVAKSTGENQILSLSFVGAVASLARDRAEEDAEASGGLVGYAGGIYPIVMDAAFASLDNNYRRDIARALPTLAPQVVVLVSRAQGEGPVEQQLRPHIGEEYVVTFNSSKADREPETIEVRGQEIPYVVPGQDEDRAVLRRVDAQ